MQRTRSLAIGIICCSLSVAAYGQLTIDATGPIRKLRWEVQGGSGGSAGARIPVSVRVERTGATETAGGPIKVEFTLTNTGNSDFEIPISTQPADLEPNDPNVEYTVTDLALSISEVAPPFKIVAMVALYGKPDVAGTMIRLAPGHSICVLAMVRFPYIPSDGTGSGRFRALASQRHDAFTIRDGRRLLDGQDIGSSFSEEFTPQSLPYVSTCRALFQ